MRSGMLSISPESLQSLNFSAPCLLITSCQDMYSLSSVLTFSLLSNLLAVVVPTDLPFRAR